MRREGKNIKLLSRTANNCVCRDITSFFPKLDHSAEDSFASTRQALQKTPFLPVFPCVSHGTLCSYPVAPAFHFAGTPCPPWSALTAGPRRREHPDAWLFLVWCAMLRAAPARVVIHENVSGFDLSLMREELGSLYHITEIKVNPADAGFGFVCRRRVFHVLFLKSRHASPPDVECIYSRIKAYQGGHYARTTDVWRASVDDLLMEENSARKRRGLETRDVHSGNWEYLLTTKQRERLARQQNGWYSKTGRHAEHDGDCVFDLSMSSSRAHLPMTSHIPCFTSKNQILWSPSRRRWLLPVERAAAMGHPVFHDLASAAGVPVSHEALNYGSAALGSSIHVASAGMVFLAALVADSIIS